MFNGHVLNGHALKGHALKGHALNGHVLMVMRLKVMCLKDMCAICKRWDELTMTEQKSEEENNSDLFKQYSVHIENKLAAEALKKLAKKRSKVAPTCGC